MKYVLDINTPYKTGSTLLTLLCVDNLCKDLPAQLQNPNVPGTLNMSQLLQFRNSDFNVGVCKRHSVNKLIKINGIKVISININRPFSEIILSYCNHKSLGAITFFWVFLNIHLIIFKSWETMVLQNFCKSSDFTINHFDLISDPEATFHHLMRQTNIDWNSKSMDISSLYSEDKVSSLAQRTKHSPSFFKRKKTSSTIKLLIFSIAFWGRLMYFILPSKAHQSILKKIRR